MQMSSITALSLCYITPFKLRFLHKHLSGADLDKLPSFVLGVHLSGHVVQEDPGNDHGGPEAGESRDLIPEHQDRAPDQSGPLASVGHAVGDGADVIHEVVSRESLGVKEDAIDAIAEEELGRGGCQGIPVHQEEHRRKRHCEAGYTWKEQDMMLSVCKKN